MATLTGEVRRMPLGRRLLWGAGAGLLLGALAAALGSLAPTFESRTLDLRHRLLRREKPAQDRVAIVLIDEPSVEALARESAEYRWPWPRELQAAMVKFLKEAGARAILFDVLFIDDSRVGVDDDRGFGEAIREAGNVHLATKLEAGEPRGDPPILERSAVSVPGWHYPPRKGLDRPLLPVAEIAAGNPGLGVINVVQDPDNAIRRADLLFPHRGKLLPSLGLAAALSGLPEKREGSLDGRSLVIGGRRIPLEPDGRILLRYYAPLTAFPDFPAGNIIQSALSGKPLVDPALFKDRVVLVAVNIAGMEDISSAPTSKALRGVELHATVCANILSGEFLRRPPPFAGTLITVLAGLLGGLISFGAWQPFRAGAAALVLAAAWIGASFAAFRGGLVIDIFYPLAAMAAAYTSSALAGYLREGLQKRKVARAFGQYLSPVVIRDLLRSPDSLRLGGEVREITVFFSDIAGFSTFSEAMGPQELVSFLNLYLGAMTDVILERRGVVDKYEGDAIMAFWGAPERLPDHGLQACLAALEQRAALERLNERFRAEGRPVLRIRAGLNRGPAVVGNMGSAKRFSYTAMGDTVNLASRLEGANKFFGTSLMVSEAVRAAAGEAVVCRRLGRIRVVGKSVLTAVHELVGKRGEVGEEEMRRIEAFEKALEILESGDLAEAALRLEEILSRVKDPAAERCLLLARDRISAGGSWDGIWELTEK